MSDQFSFEDQNTPEEVRKTLIQFLGQTYKDVSQYDSNIVSPNQFLSHKKHEFQKTAEKVMQEALGGPRIPVSSGPVIHPTPINQPPRPYLDGGNVNPPPPNDPNQMEFSFDNSVTAITINSKLEDIEKRIKKLDKLMEKVVVFLENESKNFK
jgi:predicted acylesterase/phospholipase RssA